MLSALITHLRVSGVFFYRIINVKRRARCGKIAAFANAFAVFCVKRDRINAAAALLRLEFRISHRLGLLAETSRDVFKRGVANDPDRCDRRAAECKRASLAAAQENARLGRIEFKVEPSFKCSADSVKGTHTSSLEKVSTSAASSPSKASGS